MHHLEDVRMTTDEERGRLMVKGAADGGIVVAWVASDMLDEYIGSFDSEAIAISEEERKEINFRENQEDYRLEWDVDKETSLIVDFSKDEMEYLRKACEKISDEELPDDMWATVEAVYNEMNCVE